MVTQIYDNSNYTGTNIYFIVSRSEDQMYKELKDFIKKYGTDSNTIWVYRNPVKPSKINLRPEYSMEISIKDRNDITHMMFYQKVWP